MSILTFCDLRLTKCAALSRLISSKNPPDYSCHCDLKPDKLNLDFVPSLIHRIRSSSDTSVKSAYCVSFDYFSAIDFLPRFFVLQKKYLAALLRINMAI